jgi:hypothetical protein
MLFFSLFFYFKQKNMKISPFFKFPSNAPQKPLPKPSQKRSLKFSTKIQITSNQKTAIFATLPPPLNFITTFRVDSRLEASSPAVVNGEQTLDGRKAYAGFYDRRLTWRVPPMILSFC